MKKLERMLIQRELERVDFLNKMIREEETKELAYRDQHAKHSYSFEYHDNVLVGLRTALAYISGTRQYLLKQLDGKAG